MTGEAVIFTKRGSRVTRKRVYLQQRADMSGGYWATSTPENSNVGWSLYGDGRVVKERYHARTNERLSSERVEGATWDKSNDITEVMTSLERIVYDVVPRDDRGLYSESIAERAGKTGGRTRSALRKFVDMGIVEFTPAGRYRRLDKR